MIDHSLSFPLPLPWVGQTFQTDRIGEINFLVGPNGSGKSRFAEQLTSRLNNARLLGADRLSGMEQVRPLQRFVGDPFSDGIAKNRFRYLRGSNPTGSGFEAIVLLQERIDLRIQIEATLSHLFDRDITLEWDSGNLLPKARLRGRGQSYRLDREECHGIKELLVLLTHLYNDKHQYLVIDEPELNLHPQFQAFFMQEIRKVAGDPTSDSKKKVVFLITHSPFILDLRSSDDFKSVIAFDLQYSSPKQIANLDLDFSSNSSLVRRLNAHHKQLFFSDNPVFVEGIHDAWLVEAIMETQGVSVARAGSCIIDAGGDKEVNQYLKLCQGLGKDAHFLYDLDSLFSGELRACIKDDESLQGVLLSAGLGHNFAKYCGQLQKKLNAMINPLLSETVPPSLDRLKSFLRCQGPSPWQPQQWAKAQVAVMKAISRYRDDVVLIVNEQAVRDIEGHRDQIINVLREKNIHVLPGGTLETYLPNYQGDEYKLGDAAKKKAVLAELDEIACLSGDEDLSSRYGDLYNIVRRLPAKPEVDVETVLRNHLGDYIHELQKVVVKNQNWEKDQIEAQINSSDPSHAAVFSIHEFARGENGRFDATIEITELLGQGKRWTEVDEHTIAGMLGFAIHSNEPTIEGTP